MRSSSRRGQAALEFLMTYGWALIVVIVGLSAFVYFMGSSSSLAPESCVFQPGFMCGNFKVSQVGNSLLVILQSGLGSGISGNVVLTVEDSNTICDDQTTTVSGWVDQETKTLTVDCSGGTGPALTQNDRFRGQLKLEYTHKGITRTKTGELKTVVEP